MKRVAAVLLLLIASALGQITYTVCYTATTPPPSIIQSHLANDDEQNSITSNYAQFTSPTTAGSALWVTVGIDNASVTPSSVVITCNGSACSGGDTAVGTAAGTATGLTILQYYVCNITASSNYRVTVNYSGGQYSSINIHEVSGIATTTCLRTSNHTDSVSGTSQFSTAVTPTTGDFVGMFAETPSYYTWTAGNCATATCTKVLNTGHNAGNTAYQGATEWGLATVSTSQNITLTPNSAANGGTQVIVLKKK